MARKLHPYSTRRPVEFSRDRQPKPCVSCGRNTTGPIGVASDTRLCSACYDAAGLQNEHWDGHHEGRSVPGCLGCKQRGGA